MNIKTIALALAHMASCSLALAGPEQGRQGAWTKELIKLKNLGVAIQHYQAEHGPNAWPNFDQLLIFGGENVKSQFGAFIDPQTGKSQPWVYMPESKPTSGTRIVLIAAPLARPADRNSNGKEWRPVLWSDFTAEFLDEGEYQKRIKRVKLDARDGK